MSLWTKEQKNAIEASGCSIIVSAAAGSGKTSVLVERLIRIISDTENKIPVEKMIVATFTNDAAAEMKQRLSTAMSRLIEKDPDNRWLSRQYSMIGSASISTIHSFCFELIRNNISQLDFSSNYRIMDETEENILRSETMRELIEKYYTDKQEIIKLFNDNFCKGSNDKELESFLLSIYKNISSIPFFKRWMDEVTEKYDSGIYKEYYIKHIKKEFKRAEQLLYSMKRKIDKSGSAKLEAMLSEDELYFEYIKNTVFNANIKGSLDKIRFKNFPRFSKDETASEDERAEIKAIRDSMIDIVKKTAPDAFELLAFEKDDIYLNKKIMNYLKIFISEYDENLRKRKYKKNAIGFDDAEQLALELLAQCDDDGNIIKTSLAKELSQYYEIIMIDEFQDSNNRQDMIFRLLSKNGNASSYGNNLFFVGDVKQSIYRFRLANPDNFISAIENAAPYKKGTDSNSYIKLNKNFRSSDEVIDFVNYIFSHIMMKDTAGIDYNKEEYLVRGANFYPFDRSTEIIMLDKKNSPAEAEAACIAEKIYHMIKEKHPVSVNGGKSFRPCEMKDFCILKRSKTNNDLYVKELEKRGITVESEEIGGYLKSREVSVLINLLKVVDNPMNDLALVSAMMSPMFAINADDITTIRLTDRKDYIYNNIAKGLGLNGSESTFSDDIRSKVQFIYDTIAELRLYSSVSTIRELIQKIYDETDFLSVMQLYKDSERKKANLRLLLEYAEVYEKNSNGGLSGFLRYIDRISEKKDDFKSAAASSSQNAVALKTMHKSKGLEFPFVFIADTSHNFNNSDDSVSFQFSYDMGLGFTGQNKEKYERFKTLPSEVIKLYNRRNRIAEEMRLLYVALTRAKEKLFITLDISEPRAKKAVYYSENMLGCGGITSDMICSVSSMGDWLLMSLLSMKKNAPLRDKLGILKCFSYNEDLNINYEFYSNPEVESEFAKADTENIVLSSEESIKALERIINTQYNMRLSDLTAKLSVSDISKENEEFSSPLKRPKFASENKGLTNAEKGTALHKFLQFADFSSLEKGIEPEIERLYKSGYLTALQKDSINPDDVLSFLNSDLYKRIKKSCKVIREMKFLISINDLDLDNDFGIKYKNTEGMLNGIIDMAIIEDNSIILVDYKTDRINDINVLAEKYFSQLMLYKKALDKIQRFPVSEAIIYSFHKKAAIKIF